MSKRTTKLSIFAILVGISYFAMVFFSFFNGWDDFRRGYTEGSNSRELKEDNKEQTMFIAYMLSDQTSIYHSADTLYNKRTNEKQPVIISEARIYYPKADMPRSVKLGLGFSFFVTLPVLFLYVAIPVKFGKLIYDISHEKIFTSLNIRRMRQIGLFLLLVFAFMFVSELIHYFSIQILFDFESYKIHFRFQEFIWLVLGFISLLLAEVMDRAKTLKEEQELTV